MRNSGTFRKKKIYFSQVSNEALRDENLSLKAKGLYALIQSYITIENFILYKETLKSACRDGRDSFNSAWKELKDQGYLKQYKMQDEKGKIYYEYDLLDVPKKELIIVKNDDKTNSPHTENPYTENPSYGKRGVYNNTINNNTYSKYVSMYEKHLAITEEFKNFLINNDIEKRMDLDTFEAILVSVMNNNRVKVKDKYFKQALIENLNKGIKTLEEYNQSLEDFKKQKKSTGSKNVNKITTRFHNINETFRNYGENELEDMLKKSQENKFGEKNPIHNSYIRAMDHGLNILSEPLRKIVLEYAQGNNLEIPK